MSEHEWFVANDVISDFCTYPSTASEDSSRKFNDVAEWGDFVSAVRHGDAIPRAYKQFPYKDSRPQEEWEVERECWFEWDAKVTTHDQYRYVVVHAHSLIKWDERHTAEHPMAVLGQVNVRHCRTHKDFPNDGSKPSSKMQGELTERRGLAVGKFNDIGGLDWRDEEGAAAEGADGVRDVILAGEGTLDFTKAKDRSFQQKSLELTEGESNGAVQC